MPFVIYNMFRYSSEPTLRPPGDKPTHYTVFFSTMVLSLSCDSVGLNPKQDQKCYCIRRKRRAREFFYVQYSHCFRDFIKTGLGG